MFMTIFVVMPILFLMAVCRLLESSTIVFLVILGLIMMGVK